MSDKIKKQKSIRMRINKDVESTCRVCGALRKNVLEMFDIAFTPKHVITICDLCNGRLFSASLRATCIVNGKVKTNQDIAIINARRRRMALYDVTQSGDSDEKAPLKHSRKVQSDLSLRKEKKQKKRNI